MKRLFHWVVNLYLRLFNMSIDVELNKLQREMRDVRSQINNNPSDILSSINEKLDTIVQILDKLVNTKSFHIDRVVESTNEVNSISKKDIITSNDEMYIPTIRATGKIKVKSKSQVDNKSMKHLDSAFDAFDNNLENK